MTKNMINLQSDGKEVTSLLDTDLMLWTINLATVPDDAVISWATLKTLINSNHLLPDGYMVNGKLSVTVSTNNLIVALKTKSGGNPSAADPVSYWANGSFHSVTGALSVTLAAGTNWYSAASSTGSYRAYLGYNATDGVVIGVSPIAGKIYSDFSTTNTSPNYAAISTITNATASDDYVCIGTFNATLGAAASYNWSLPTPSNIISTPPPNAYATLDRVAIHPSAGWCIRLSDVITDATTKIGRMAVRHYTNTEEDMYVFAAASTVTANSIAFGGVTASGVMNCATAISFITAATTTTLNGTRRLLLDKDGNVVVGSAALATNATNGFLYIPTCAGTPTGVPTAYTGMVAIIYDTTNNKLAVYNGAWKQTGALT
jgi:hypothetical protein